jgi:hypothetical protein
LKILATTVVRGSRPGESQGGAYLLDLDAREARRVLESRDAGIEGASHGASRGLRGIAFDGDTVYIASSDALHAYTPDFRRVGSWRNAYLQQCHEIALWERRLFVTSAGCDAILGFDLDAKVFNWGMQIVAQQFRLQARGFDPRKDEGPLMLDKLHLNAVHCTRGGMYVTGLKTGGMLLFNGRTIQMAVELPPGSRNARPFRNGVLFNDTEAGMLRYSERDGSEDRAFRVPAYPAESILNGELDPSGVLRQGFARGLEVLPGGQVAAGSSPATVSVYDLPSNSRVLSANLTMDVRHAIDGLAAWPF